MKHCGFCLIVCAILLTGACIEGEITTPPVTLGEVEQQQARRGAYSQYVIVQHNLQRVMDKQLPVDQRRASLEVVTRYGKDSPGTMDTLASLLSDPDAPAELTESLLGYLTSQADPAMTSFALAAMAQPNTTEANRQRILKWLTDNADKGALAEIVKLWAAQDVSNESAERRFRMVVHRLTAKSWDRALLAMLNDREFSARGSALAVLAQRLPEETLRGQFLALTARTEAVAAIQTFIGGFDYMPASRAALIQTVVAYKTQRSRLQRVADLATYWRGDRQVPYRFDIRDFPLMTAISGDPEAIKTSRTTLTWRLRQSLLYRRHAPYRAGGQQGASISTRLTGQTDKLSMADLWDLWLLDRMLDRAAVRSGLKVLAGRDRADTRSAQGGLIVFERGRAEAKLYPPLRSDLANDLVYEPSPQMLRAERKALCRFTAHFERLANDERTGPTPQELAAAKENNIPGLTITSLDEKTFTAHYYTPNGIVISLGKFPFTGELRRRRSAKTAKPE
ncbi:MAG: hypothetical protein ACYS8X_07595 [Planctomycetota bacterium]|jgi:hypothetical protein